VIEGGSQGWRRRSGVDWIVGKFQGFIGLGDDASWGGVWARRRIGARAAARGGARGGRTGGHVGGAEKKVDRVCLDFILFRSRDTVECRAKIHNQFTKDHHRLTAQLVS
jgi:hypothetical protein